jgi:hypothetical protein
MNDEDDLARLIAFVGQPENKVCLGEGMRMPGPHRINHRWYTFRTCGRNAVNYQECLDCGMRRSPLPGYYYRHTYTDAAGSVWVGPMWVPDCERQSKLA